MIAFRLERYCAFANLVKWVSSFGTAPLAQSVERGPFKPVVVGSSPTGGVLLRWLYSTTEPPPVNKNDPREIRTPNLLIWSQMHYRCAIEPLRNSGSLSLKSDPVLWVVQLYVCGA